MDALTLFIKLCYKYGVPNGSTYKDAVEIMKEHGATIEELNMLEKEKVRIFGYD